MRTLQEQAEHYKRIQEIKQLRKRVDNMLRGRKSSKSLTQFIRENRPELDQVINSAIYRHDGNGGRGVVPVPAPRHNDRERRLWILNDEGLYNWARSEGVRI